MKHDHDPSHRNARDGAEGTPRPRVVGTLSLKAFWDAVDAAPRSASRPAADKLRS